MARNVQEEAVRNYLVSLKDPTALRDEDTLEKLRGQLADASDELERVRLQQQIIDAERPAVQSFEEAFVTHARAWAEQSGVSDRAFLAEGVPPAVLRRAGFRNVRGGRRAVSTGRRTRTRVSADEVRAAIPKGTFTIKRLQELSGASPAVVRRIVQEESQAGRLTEKGTDPDHQGPGRAPVLYQQS